MSERRIGEMYSDAVTNVAVAIIFFFGVFACIYGMWAIISGVIELLS